MRSPLLALVLAPLLAGCPETPPPVAPSYYTQPVPRPLVYRLPVDGEWFVFRTHYGAKNDQAWALDLAVLADGNSTHRGDGRKNTDYAAYNQPVVADAPGIVAIVVDGVPENEPGVGNVYDMHGNYVVIDHQNGEYSLFAHLIPGSLRVRPGQPIQAGMELGRCGNSGHSSEPHVHWQVMNRPLAHTAQPVQPRYAPYMRNGQITTSIPDRHDRVTAPPSS